MRQLRIGPMKGFRMGLVPKRTNEYRVGTFSPTHWPPERSRGWGWRLSFIKTLNQWHVMSFLISGHIHVVRGWCAPPPQEQKHSCLETFQTLPYVSIHLVAHLYSLPINVNKVSSWVLWAILVNCWILGGSHENSWFIASRSEETWGTWNWWPKWEGRSCHTKPLIKL